MSNRNSKAMIYELTAGGTAGWEILNGPNKRVPEQNEFKL